MFSEILFPKTNNQNFGKPDGIDLRRKGSSDGYLLRGGIIALHEQSYCMKRKDLKYCNHLLSLFNKSSPANLGDITINSLC